MGRGRVALLLSDHAWLWARGYDGGGPHTDLLRRLAHWLMKEPDLEEERLIASSKGLKRHHRAPLHGGDGARPSRCRRRAGRPRRSTLEKAGLASGARRIDVKVPGLYKLQSASARRQLTAVTHAGLEDAREMSEVTATDDEDAAVGRRRPAAACSGRAGGGLLSSVQPPAVDVPRVSMLANARVLAGSGWLGLKDREAFVTRGVKLTPMFTGLLALAALLFFITLAWWREGR